MRLALLMKEEYTNRPPNVDDVLPKPTENKPSGFEYMIKRTLMRPRDLIAFFNKVIEKADGQTKITRQHISSAEIEYSFDRLQAIEDEWYDNFGPLYPLYEFLKNRYFRFTLNELNDSCLNHLYTNNIVHESSIVSKARVLLETKDFLTAMQLVLATLYRTGIIVVKLSPKDPTYYSFLSNKILSPSEIQLDSKFYVHYTFHRALSVKDQSSQ